MKKNKNEEPKQNENPEEEVLEFPEDEKVEVVDENEPAEAEETSEEAEAEVSGAEAELAEMKDRYMRLLAEYDNFRRRTQKEKENIYADAVAEVVKEWLPLVDDIERAVASSEDMDEQSVEKVAEGIRLINEAAPSDAVIRIKSLEAFAKAADGQATKIIIPSEIQGLAGLATSLKEIAADDKKA